AEPLARRDPHAERRVRDLPRAEPRVRGARVGVRRKMRDGRGAPARPARLAVSVNLSRPSMPDRTAPKAYDRAYYEKWYHDPKRRVITRAAVARKVRLTVGIAESLLERPIRSVLDVGCGEGTWRAHLRELRPKVRYVGVESSDYVIERFGASRG